MRLYLTIIFIIAFLFEVLAFFFSKYREKINVKFIESEHDLLSIVCHHLLALLNIIVLIISFIVLGIYAILLLTIIFSILTHTEINLNPLLNVPFSVTCIICLVIIFIVFEILCKVNKLVKKVIDNLCDINNPNNDEKMGITGNLRYSIIVYVIPLTILLFLINVILGIQYV